MEIDLQTRGTRILFGSEPAQRRKLINYCALILESQGYNEITLPSIEPAAIYESKAGKEVLDQMYVFPDKKGRQLCLRPEGTATIQLIANTYWPVKKNVKLWYFEKCWRYERPQRGRYREFWQLGVEVINPTDSLIKEELIDLAISLVKLQTSDIEVNYSVKRGLDYYVEDGFEIACNQLGAQKQICGGGRYKEGIGFAIGFDRLMLCK